MNERRTMQYWLRGATAAGVAAIFALSTAGCKSKDAQAPIVSSTDQAAADGNLAQPYTGGTAGTSGSAQPAAPARVMGASQSYAPQANGENYAQQPAEQGYDQQAAPIVRQAPGDNGAYQGDGYDQNAYDQSYTDNEQAGEEALAESDQPPPPLPEYDQPPAPEDNYIWTPGYWNYAPTGYYWVPGAWVAPPYYGALWTPPWWGWGGGRYRLHHGYWGEHVGYYGGVNYGFGYIGVGYFGGYWRGRDFVYNRSVSNVNTNLVHNVYQRNVVYDGVQYGPHPTNRVSYNGGRGGLNVQPRPAELAALHEAHYAAVPAQREIRMQAASNRSQFFAANRGRPAQTFAAHPVGTVRAIAAAPTQQPFNHPNAVNGAGRTGQALQPNLNNGRAGAPANQTGAPGFRPGVVAPGQNPALNAQRPGQTPGTRPGFQGQIPTNQNAGNRPGLQGQRPNETNQGVRPGFQGQQTGTQTLNRPGVQPANHPGFQGQTPTNRPGIQGQTPANRPGIQGQQPGTQPGFNGQRSTPQVTRPATPTPNPGQNRPQFNAPRQQPATNYNAPVRPSQAAAPAIRPTPQAAPAFHQAPQATPAYHPAQPQAPAVRQAAPARPASAPAARPEAPQPHAGGNGAHPEGHDHVH